MRTLAEVKRIDAINSIPGADAIEVATVGGWKVVVKKGDFQANELAVYCEIDSWIPESVAPFLFKGKEFNGVKGERLRTIKLRGQLSQGLLLPTTETVEGTDVTELLGIQKWEAPIPACLAGDARGNFPSTVRKTDQVRVQNLDFIPDDLFEVTEKLDGSSCTFFLDADGEFHVCSRNLDLKPSDTNSFWKAAIANNVEQEMREAGLMNFAIQGELIGEGIQGNPYNIHGQQFYMFDIFDASTQTYVAPEPRQHLSTKLAINHVPVVQSLQSLSVDDLLAQAEGKSVLNPKTEREGLVFKSTNFSFKAISNRFLLKEK